MKLQRALICDVPEKEFFFPAGLLGFAACRRYQLERFQPGDGSESPFFMLRSLDQDVSFPLIHHSFLPVDYRLSLAPEVLADLNKDCADGLIVMFIVTVRDRVEETTVNLQGPLVLNPAASLGLQLIVEDYPVRHFLLTATTS